MPQILELWRWRVTDKVSRRSFVTRYPMTEAQALNFDPAAERIDGSLEQRVVQDHPRSSTHTRATAANAGMR